MLSKEATVEETFDLNEFNEVMETQQTQIIKDSLSLIDKKNFLLNVIKAKGLLKLSPEILKIN